MSKPNSCSRDQRHDDSAVFNVVPCLERVIPIIEKLRHMSPNAKRQDQDRTELNKPSPHLTQTFDVESSRQQLY